MPEDGRTFHMNFPVAQKYLRIKLPHGIGYVEISQGNVHGPTGFPIIGVDAVSETKDTPAADGRNYEPARDRDSGVVLVGRPGAKMLEEERFMKRAADIIRAHDSGDHTGCPDTCTGRPAENYTIAIAAKDKNGQPATIHLDHERLTNMQMTMRNRKDSRSVTWQGEIYVVRSADIAAALGVDVPRETSGE